MKPIKLKIKGLNSFIEEQTIDFEKLGSRGLFGIFGPTGSGKSTVLDGITLALYGNVARKSNNFININCDRMNVSFEFQVSAAEIKRYVVDREFKRSSNSIRAGKCKIIDITDLENKEVLADGVKSLNKKVEEIIGLNLEDFTRTVVLPQGKFSEFLKLEGKERREMLERLFNLQKYGDELSQKLYSKIAEEKNKNSILSGQLKGYEDISEELLNNKVINSDEIEKKLKGLTDELERLTKKYNDSEELWNYQIELSKYKEENNKLENERSSIDAKNKKINLGEASNRVLPYINAYEDTLKKFEKNQKELIAFKTNLEIMNKEKDEVKKKWIEAKEEKENKLPKLIVDEEKAKKALEESKILKSIEINISSIKKSIMDLREKFNKDTENLNKINEMHSEKNLNIQKNEQEHESLKIDEEFKQKVQSGLICEENVLRISDNLTKQKRKKTIIDNDINDIIREGKILKDSLDKIENSLKAKEKELENLIKNCPGEQKDIIKLNQVIVQNEQKWETYNKLSTEIEEAKKKLKSLYSNNENEQKSLSDRKINLDELKRIHKECVKEQLAYKLREELKDGDVCPVCGSTHHIKKNIKEVHMENIDVLEKKIKNAEEEINTINMKIVKEQANMANIENKIKENEEEIKKLGNEFKEKSIDELKDEASKFEKNINAYNDKKESLDKEINNIRINQKEQDGEIKALRAKLRSAQNQSGSLEKDICEISKEYEDFAERLKALKEETNVLAFRDENEKIKIIELKREKISKFLKKLKDSIKILEENREKLSQELSRVNEQIVKNTSELQGLENNRQEKIDSIRNNVGEQSDLEGYLIRIQEDILKINDVFASLDKRKNEIEEKFIKCREKVTSLEDNNISLE